MKKLLTILCMLVTLSVTAQQISPQAASICLGDSAQLVVTPNDTNGTYRYIWSNSLPDTNIVVVMPNATTTYTVTILIDSSSVFIGQATATVTVNQLPTPTISGGLTYCENQTISLTASGGTNYSWSGPGGFSSNTQNITRAATVPNAGSYTVTATNSNGCTASASTTVVVNPIPTPNVGSNTPVCVGSTIGLTANSGYVSYSWTGPVGFISNSQNPVRSNVTQNMGGNYSVTVTDANGCIALAVTPVVVNPNPTVTATGSPVSCFGLANGSATVSATVGSPFTYLWNTSATTQSISSLTPGVYTATVTNSFGCSASDTAVVSQPLAAVTASTTVTNVSCNGGNNGTATVSVTGGTSPYTYLWSNGGTNSSTGGLSAGNYTVTITDANGCSTTATGTVGQPTILTANADSSAVTCNGGSNGQVWVLPNGGTPPYNYVWSNAATTQYVSNLTAGTYGVTVTDANGCTTTSSTVVLQPVAITLSAAITPVTCNSGNNGSIDLTVSGGTSPYTYLWSNGATVQDPSGLVAGTKTVTVSDANGCSATGSWVVNQPAALVLIASSTNATCVANGTASVSVSGGTAPYNYVWSNSGTNSSITAPAGIYTVTVNDVNGCQAVMSDTIGQPIVPVITGNLTGVSCFGGNNGSVDITPSGVGPFTYAWSNGSTTQDLVNVGTGIYTIIVTGSNGCIGTNQFTVLQPPILTATIPNSTVNCYGELGALTVNVGGGTSPYSYGWNTVPGQTTQTASNLAPGLGYTAIVVDANGCTAVASAVVTQPSQLLAVISNQQNIACAGNSNGSASVSVSGGTAPYIYLWSNGSQIPTAYGLSAGSYTVTVTDANGCQATTTATISTTGSSLYANMTSDPSCGNSNTGSVTASVSGGQQPYQYAWTLNGNPIIPTSPILSGLAPGNYGVTITDANGCSWQGSQQVQGSPNIVVNLTNEILCEGNNELILATFTGGTFPYQFVWTMPYGQIFTSNGINPSQEGTYQLTVIDAFGCQASGSMYIDLIPCTNTGVEDVFSDENVSIFPNPISSGGVISVQLPLNIHDVTIQLLDITGKILSQEIAHGEIYQLNTFGISSGTYMVRIVSGEGIATKRLIIQ